MDDLNEKIKRVFADLGIRCAYNMPSFWANGGKDYIVIPTRYAKGYQKALEDAEREITEVLSEQPEHTETHSCDYQRTGTHDLVSRRAALEAMDTWDKFGCDPDGKLVRYDDDKHYVPYVHYEDMVHAVKNLPPAQPRWIPVTLETLPNLNSVVVVCGKKGTWDYGTYRGWSGDIHSWQWKKNTIKHVYWWMYKADALPEQYEGEQNEDD